MRLKGIQSLALFPCFLLLCALLCSCGKSGELLPNQKAGKTDFSHFVFAKIAEYGGTHGRATVRGIIKKSYVYSEDPYGFQVVFEGNEMVPLYNLFRAQFGEAALIKTNSTGVTFFGFSARQSGVGITCSMTAAGKKKDAKQFTHLIVLREGALDSGL